MEDNSQLYQVGDTIRVKCSGDRAKFSCTSTFILLSFGSLAKEANVLSGSGIITKLQQAVHIEIHIWQYRDEMSIPLFGGFKGVLKKTTRYKRKAP